MPYTPPPRKTYKGSITDTDRWQDVRLRASDVFVCTPPKCGTTWTTTIVTMLCQDNTDIAPQRLIHWVDANIIPLHEVTRGLEQQDSQRCIKSHTPLDGLPWRADAHYIAVYRHPIDMFFSLRKHLANEVDTGDDHPYLGDADAALRIFIEEEPEDLDRDCLSTFLTHYRATTQSPQPGNLLVLHYADMLAGPGRAIRNIAGHIGLSLSPEFLDEVREATSFGNMKSNPDRFTPYADKGYWHDPQAFFHSAGTRKWEGQVSDDTLALYNAKMAKALKPADIDWLENGSLASKPRA